MNKLEKRRLVYKKYDGHCAYCGREIDFKEMQVDHLEPKALNRPIGRDLEGRYVYPDINTISNLMPSCRRCNHYKRANTLKVYRYLISTVIERLSRIYIFKVAQDYGIIQIKPFDGKFYFEQKQKEI